MKKKWNLYIAREYLGHETSSSTWIIYWPTSTQQFEDYVKGIAVEMLVFNHP
jgi:hypothetical protein